jgi:hypothetical protein
MMRAPLVVLCVLLSVATASAECAWVLWRSDWVILANETPKSITIVIEDIADTQERCKSLMSASVARSAEEPDVVKILPHAIGYQHKSGETEVRNYGCAPDTKDLRVLLKDLPPWLRGSP